MQKFDKCRGLFAEQGGFGIPANLAGDVAGRSPAPVPDRSLP